MRIYIAALALVSSLTTSMATPAIDRRNHTAHSIALIENTPLAKKLPPTCNLIACVGLSGTFTCILSAISTGDTTALRQCLSGGLGEICECAACLPNVNNFLQALGVCVSGLDIDNVTDSLVSNLLSEMRAAMPSTFDPSKIVPKSVPPPCFC